MADRLLWPRASRSRIRDNDRHLRAGRGMRVLYAPLLRALWSRLPPALHADAGQEEVQVGDSAPHPHHLPNVSVPM